MLCKQVYFGHQKSYMPITTDKDRNKQFAFILLLSLGCYLFYLLSDFFTPFLGAVIFYMLFYKSMAFLTEKHKWRKSFAVFLIIIISFLAITVPVFLLSFLLYSKISAAFNSQESILNIIHLIDDKVNTLTGYDILSDDTINVLKIKAGNLIPDLLGKVIDILGQVLICYFLLFYMLFYYKEIPVWLEKYLPLGSENTAIFIKELESMTRSNVIGSPLLALIQSVAAIIGFYIFGVEEPLFWGFMCGFLSFVPFIGSALVYVPIGILLLSLGHNWQGIGTLIYGFVVIGSIDDVMRFVIQKKFADVHPLITVFGVIIGLQLFGLPGLIFGPLMISYFILGVMIYRRNYIDKDRA